MGDGMQTWHWGDIITVLIACSGRIDQRVDMQVTQCSGPWNDFERRPVIGVLKRRKA
jgi:hypothetical protein